MKKIISALLIALIAGIYLVLQPAKAVEPTPTAEEIRQECIAKADDAAKCNSSNSRETGLSNLQVSSVQAPSTDQYGYTRQVHTITQPLTALDGSKITFTSPDDGYASIPIGLNFPFYDSAYSTAYVSTNGLISFDGDTSKLTYRNEAVPQPTSTNALIAILWDDLTLADPSADAYYALKGTAPDRYFVIEWHNVQRFNDSTFLNLVLALHENGDIQMQYQILNHTNEATIGIEAWDGKDGLMYSLNVDDPDLRNGGKELIFTRPGDQGRARVWPTYSSNFSISRLADHTLSIRNTGKTIDTFDIIPPVSSWTYNLYQQDGLTPLTNTNGNAYLDTGALAPGQEFTITVKVSPPSSLEGGSYDKSSLAIQSSQPSGRSTQSSIQSAIPVPFAMIYANGEPSVRLGLYQPFRKISKHVDNWFSGSNMNLSAISNNLYLFSWERGSTLGGQEINVEYNVLNPKGEVLYPTTPLEENHGKPYTTKDFDPSGAGTDNGKTGFIFTRNEITTSLGTRSNIMFSLLNFGGTSTAINVTNNSAWYKPGVSETAPIFRSPRVLAAKNNIFFLFWLEERQTGGESRNIIFQRYDSSSEQFIGTKQNLTSAPAGGDLYHNISPALLDDGRVFIAYTRCDSGEENCQIVFTVLNSNGSVAKAETQISTDESVGADVVTLDNGKILVSWTDYLSSKIHYVLLNSGNFNSIPTSSTLSNPDYRDSDYVSVTRDRLGRGIITWLDRSWNDYIYYAVIDGDGNLVTEPMIIHSPPNFDLALHVSQAGQGNAPLNFWEVFLPISVR